MASCPGASSAVQAVDPATQPGSTAFTLLSDGHSISNAVGRYWTASAHNGVNEARQPPAREE